MAEFRQQPEHTTGSDLSPQLLEECTNPACKKRILALEHQLERMKSAGYDILKQRGAWLVSGQNPTNSSLDFNNLFDHEVEDVARGLRNNATLEEDEARLLVGQEFQKIYEKCKEIVFKKLVETLYKVFLIGTDEDSDEKLFDICRAYGLLLNASGVLQSPGNEEIARETHGELKLTSEGTVFTEKASKLSWDLLTTIPPLISAEPQTEFYKEWHDKELSPTWNKDLTEYELVYYRPILFMSCEGKVARKGWVGNKRIGSTPSSSTDEMMSSVVLPAVKSDDSEMSKLSTKELPHKVVGKHTWKPRIIKPRRSGTSPIKTSSVTTKASIGEPKPETKSLKPNTQGASQERLPSEQQTSPVRTLYHPQTTYYADKDKDGTSTVDNTTTSNNDSHVWTGETMWRMRP